MAKLRFYKAPVILNAQINYKGNVGKGTFESLAKYKRSSLSSDYIIQ